MQQKDLVMKKGDILFCNTIQVKSKKGTSKDLFNLVADQIMPVVRELRMYRDADQAILFFNDKAFWEQYRVNNFLRLKKILHIQYFITENSLDCYCTFSKLDYSELDDYADKVNYISNVVLDELKDYYKDIKLGKTYFNINLLECNEEYGE